jgi:hypothetical protein
MNRNVIPPLRVQWEVTALDIFMLTMPSSSERTEPEWLSLI